MTFPEISKTSLEVVTDEGNARSSRATRRTMDPSGRGCPGRSSRSAPCSQTASCPHPRLKEEKMFVMFVRRKGGLGPFSREGSPPGLVPLLVSRARIDKSAEYLHVMDRARQHTV